VPQGLLSSLGLGISSQDMIVHTQVDLLEKEKATARAVQWSLETGGSCSGEGWDFSRML
jgi:hypothetical protein